MKNRLYFLFAGIIALNFYSYYAAAQDETDALRYSNLSTQGTARSMGFGGALGSIGGDFSSLTVNPAGIGVYRGSEFMFTPSIKLNNTSGDYLGTTTRDNDVKFTFNNIGVVFTNSAKGRRYDKSKWKSVSFGLGINRIADFNRNYTYSGLNRTSSATEAFIPDANANAGNLSGGASTLTNMAYSTYLIDSFAGLNYRNNSDKFGTVVNYGTGVMQQRSVKEKGGITDINISLGGNYMEKLLLGATLGVPSLYYHREITYTETDASGNTNNNFDNFSYTNTLTTRGSGINLKLGFIYKANDNFRFGAAFHTPTYFQLKDIYDQSITSNTEGYKNSLGEASGPVTQVSAPEGVFEYSLLTPWRGVVSASAILGKYGFITADLEYVDYSSARFNYDAAYAADESAVNNTIKTTLKAAPNFRIGAEGKLDNFMIRLGFGYYGSPYNNSDIQGGHTDVSAGVGFRQSSWYADLGFVHSMYKQTENPYVVSYPGLSVIAPVAAVTNNLNNMALTIGFKF